MSDYTIEYDGDQARAVGDGWHTRWKMATRPSRTDASIPLRSAADWAHYDAKLRRVIYLIDDEWVDEIDERGPKRATERGAMKRRG